MNRLRRQFEKHYDFPAIDMWGEREQYWMQYAKWLESKIKEPEVVNVNSKDLDLLMAKIDAIQMKVGVIGA